MTTYAQNAQTRELSGRRSRQDRHIASQTARFNAEMAARTDKRGGWKTMKYERPSFTVVTASDAFRKGYDAIEWDVRSVVDPDEANQSHPGSPKLQRVAS